MRSVDGRVDAATGDNPLGYYEALGVVDAHRNLLAQMERDWTCPPTTFRPDLLDLSALAEQVDVHTRLPGVWAMKDPRSMFLLPGMEPPWNGSCQARGSGATPRSTQSGPLRHGISIRHDRAEAIVETYLRRLLEIAEQYRCQSFDSRGTVTA